MNVDRRRTVGVSAGRGHPPVRRRAGARVRVVRAPYRICPLGAHIDHQLGPVTAMAIDRSVLLAYAPTGITVGCGSPAWTSPGPGRVPGRRRAGQTGRRLGQLPARRGAGPAAADIALERGIVGVIAGALHGGGVSSSAAVGVAFLLAFEDANGLAVAPEENIALDQAIENDYLGLRNGILDQAAILLSRRDHLTLIDCASSRHESIPAPAAMPPFRILLAFSGLRRALVGTDYNRRVDECAEAARTLLDGRRPARRPRPSWATSPPRSTPPTDTC